MNNNLLSILKDFIILKTIINGKAKTCNTVIAKITSFSKILLFFFKKHSGKDNNIYSLRLFVNNKDIINTKKLHK